MKRISRIIIVALIMALIAGTITACAATKRDVTWKTKKTKSGYVTKFYDEGNYVCKIKTKKKLQVRMYREEELDAELVEGRNNKYILIEVIEGKCINNKGDGITDCGFYISYKRLNFKKGRKYKTYCIYENNSYIDDVKARFDKRRK